MSIRKVIALSAAASAIALSGCEVEKIEDGEMPNVDITTNSGQMPKYDIDVQQTQEGRLPEVDVDVDNGKMPEYDVRGPEVTIGTQEKTISVPNVDVDVSTEEKTITVPDVDIELPENNDGQ